MKSGRKRQAARIREKMGSGIDVRIRAPSAGGPGGKGRMGSMGVGELAEGDGHSRRGRGDWENVLEVIVSPGWMHVGDMREQTYKSDKRTNMKNGGAHILAYKGVVCVACRLS